ncbi:response regulator [Chitinophaga rhizosphaerae]|uniref:response regulator n=1 Tax=Chitinophaga rhizosphaerae TaxID=1864947 RepID=UPI000F7FE81D|nr:response regulator transcription factor [Chitinophaga rhizosphaerae]
MAENGKILAVVDDHPILADGLRSLLMEHGGFEDVRSFNSGKDFMQFLAANEVDTVLLDIALQDANGVELCREIKLLSPGTIVLGLSSQAERGVVLQMIANGAGGYVLKSAATGELIECIREAQAGCVVFCSDVKRVLAKAPAHPQRTLPSLTNREKQMLELLSEGKTTPVIASELQLSRLTVDTYRKNLLQKFEVKNIAELLVLVVREGLL